ncbi:MAG: hypothetical protein FJ320_05260 [SAR202 cluster bacterium]|nr:hypothetical protein [SAR202 cluster bacterium]
MAFAQEGSSDSSTTTDSTAATETPSFPDRVAGILGLDKAKVESAFQQAAQEAADEAVRSRLDALVEQGTLTQAEADEIYEWYQSRPEALSKIAPFGGPMFGIGGHMGRGHGRHGGFGHFGYKIMPAPEAEETPAPTATTSL